MKRYIAGGTFIHRFLHYSFLSPSHMPVCESVASRILCLPLYHTLTSSDLDLITRIILRVQNYEYPAELENALDNTDPGLYMYKMML